MAHPWKASQKVKAKAVLATAAQFAGGSPGAAALSAASSPRAHARTPPVAAVVVPVVVPERAAEHALRAALAPCAAVEAAATRAPSAPTAEPVQRAASARVAARANARADARVRLAGVVRSALALPSVEGNASELLALTFPNVICTRMRECRSARWEAVISEGPWEPLTVLLGATRDVVAACVFATLGAGGGASPVRSVLLCPAFAVARAHRRNGIGSMLFETLRAVALERTCSHIVISCDRKCDVAKAFWLRHGFVGEAWIETLELGAPSLFSPSSTMNLALKVG